MNRMPQPINSRNPSIRLTLMPQLAEAKGTEDDWTGTNDATARRKAQTRLNTRAYRKRKALAKAETPSLVARKLIKSETLIECWDDEKQAVYVVPESRITQRVNARRPLLGETARKENFKLIFPLSRDHLMTLLQFNVLRALAANRSLISGFLITPLDCSDEEIMHIIPYPTKPDSVPSTLLPTILQQTVPHCDWIDAFPCPEGRDRLIRAAGTFDEDDLWADCIGGLFEGFPDDDVERRGMIAWSPPWDMSGWEMSEGFLRKWGWLACGPGMLEATNRWRKERGEEPFVYVDVATTAIV